MGFNFDEIVNIKQTSTKKPKLKGVVDIIFAIDVSGSMAPAIEELTKNLDVFVENIDRDLVKDFRIKVVSFSDLEEDRSDIALNLNRPFRNQDEIEAVKKDLQECRDIVTTYYAGGDEPESSLDAIYRSIDEFKEDWSKRRRVIILFTDAPTKSIHNSTISELNNEEKLDVLIQKILEEHVDVFIYGPLDERFKRLGQEASMRVTYEAINEDGSNAVVALRSLDFSRVLEILGKSVSQPSVE